MGGKVVMAYNKSWKPAGNPEFTYTKPLRRWRPTYTRDKGWVRPWTRIVHVTRARIWVSQSHEPNMGIKFNNYWITEEKYNSLDK